MPATDADAGAIWRFADQQTGQLDKANRRGDTILSVVEACEARDQRWREILAAPWWRRPFMKAPL